MYILYTYIFIFYVEYCLLNVYLWRGSDSENGSKITISIVDFAFRFISSVSKVCKHSFKSGNVHDPEGRAMMNTYVTQKILTMRQD